MLTIQGVSLDTAEPCDVVDMARLDTVLADDDAVAWARRVAEVNAERAKRADMVMMMDEERNSVNQESVGISNTGQTGNYMTSYNAIQFVSVNLAQQG